MEAHAASVPRPSPPARRNARWYNCRVKGYKWAAARRMRLAPTPSEKRLLAGLRSSLVLTRIEAQVPMLGWIVDVLIPSARLVIEVDGSSHEGRTESDAYRDAALERAGYVTLRFSNAEVWNDLEEVVGLIREVIQVRRRALRTESPAEMTVQGARLAALASELHPELRS